MEIKEYGIDEIKPYEKNPRKNEDSVKFVANSIKEFGFKVPIVIDADNVIVAGHTRWKAAKHLGLEKVPCIKADDLSPAQIKAFRLADNKVGEFSQWDMDLLGDELKDLGDVFNMGDFGFFDPMDDDAPTGDDDDFDPDKAAEEIENPVSQPGDLWLLGRHRLMCGDSCDEATIKRLCGDEAIDLYLTDPPYNVAYKGGTDKKLTIENDNMDSASFLAFLTDAYAAADSVLKPGCAFYIWHASCEVFNFYQAMLNIPGWMPKQYLLWVKDSFTLGRQDYQWKHEPCQPAGTKVVTPTGIVNIEDLKDGDVVVSYDSYSGLVKGTKNGGYKVKTAKRKYEGTLYGVRCNGMETWATDNHKFTVRFNSGAKKNFCTYLMKRETRWRVGVTVCYDARQFGLKTRFKQENADAAWIIAVHESKEKAQIMEQLVAVKYGLPYTVWELDRGQKVPTSKRKYEDIDWLYDNLDPLRMELGARQLLEDYGRSIRYPLLTREICRDKFSTRVTATVAACNLIPGLMQVPVSTEYDYSTNKNFKWVEIDEIARKQYCDWVYSLDVEKYQHYIADGIVVHNCIYGWKDGAAHYFVDDRKQSTVLEFDKPKRNGEHPCLSPDTLVMTIEGYRRIDSIRKGDKVLSADGKFHNVEYISRHRYVEPIYKITASGSNLHDFATHNHPYLVLRRKKSKKGDKIEIGFVNAEFLKVGDYLMTPQLEMGEKAPLSELDAFCYGLWLAQGSIQKAGHGNSSYPVFSLDAKKTRLQDKLKMWAGTRKFSIYPNHGNGVTAMIFDSAKAKRCIELFGKYAGKKKIAEEVFTWNSELRKAFFEGYMAGDGCFISTRGHRHSKSISIALSSQMKFLSESIGYKVSFYHREAPQGKGIGNRKFIHTNDFYSLDYRIEKNNISMKPFIYNGIKYWLRRLDKVEALPYDGDVINLSVEGCHTFQTACSMTHNTMKPVELFEKLVENSSIPGENVLDSFGGSGTTMVACEKLGRRAFLCELDPKYADVIVKRYINLHGNSKDVRLLKSDGTEVPYDEIAK